MSTTLPGGPPDYKKLEEYLRFERELPTLREVSVLVQVAAEDPKANANTLREAVLQDPSLTARVLRLANSSYYRVGAPRTTTITDAIVTVGFETVRDLVRRLTGYSGIMERWAQDTGRRYWCRALAGALICRRIAEVRRETNVEEAYVAGLLHDIGQLLLLVYAEPFYRQVEQGVRAGESRLVAERRIFGYDHRHAGDLLAREWRLPAVIHGSIRRHHEEDRGSDAGPYFDWLLAADRITAHLFGHPGDAPRATEEDLFKSFGLLAPTTEPDFRALLKDLRDRLTPASRSR